MIVPVIKIGNSRGIRFKKALIEQYNIQDIVELVLEKEQFIIRPISKPRKYWDKAFMEINTNGDDQLLIPDVFENEPEED